jgi:hypothetical protein
VLRDLITNRLAPMFASSPEVIRDTIGELCATNLEDPQHLRKRLDPQDAYILTSTPTKRARIERHDRGTS